MVTVDRSLASEQSVIVHLIGYPGVGKYTVGQELVRLAGRGDGRFVLVDNHLTANVVFSVIDVDGSGTEPVAQDAWDRVDDVRSALRAAIRDLSPAGWSFVFTNVAVEGDEVDRRSIGHVRTLAEERGNEYVPVRLHCEIDEHLRRVVDPARAERGKWRNAQGVLRYVGSAPLIELDDPLLLDVDVTALTPPDTAMQIMEHVRRARRP